MSPRAAKAVFLTLLYTGSLFTADKSFAVSSTATGSSRTLTFASASRIDNEEVYWRHRIWPKENPGPKPSLDAVVSAAGLEKKVSDYLRKSQALEDYCHRPITVEQLQAEITRMASQTKQPDVLRELFAALGNDPLVIAECLARPLLAERLLANWYPCDQRIHGDLKKRVEAELRAYTHTSLAQMGQLSGDYSEVEFVRSDGDEVSPIRVIPGSSTQLTHLEWTATVEKVAAIFNKHDSANRFESSAGRQVATGLPGLTKPVTAKAYTTIPVGNPSPLQEDETHFFVIVVSRTPRII